MAGGGVAVGGMAGGMAGGGAGFGGAGGMAGGGAGFSGGATSAGYMSHGGGRSPGGGGLMVAGNGGMVNGGIVSSGMVNGGLVNGGLVTTGGMVNGGMVTTGGMYPVGGVVATDGCCGCGTAGCAGCGASCGGGCTTTGQQTGALTYVGWGGGDWVTETTYRYVGMGAGNLAVVTQQRRSFIPLILVLVVVVVVAVLLLAQPTATTTVKSNFVPPPPTTMAPQTPPPPPPTTTPAPERKTCLFWGDPHLVTFDGARPSFYGDGEYRIIHTDEVDIQGRYMGTPYTYGLAATQKIAIGGPFMEGHTIMVEPMEHQYGGHILVDGQPVLLEFGELDVGGIARIVYNGQGELVDEAASQWKTRAVHISLPKGIEMTIFRWGNYLDLKITMSKLEGQDGSCGNFNGDPSDDTTAKIFERIGARVPEGELLFNKRADIIFTHEEREMLRTQCPAADLVKAEMACRKELGSATGELQRDACVFDTCFGMNEHALRSAKTYATDEDYKAAHGQ
jgi:hypothetical protein